MKTKIGALMVIALFVLSIVPIALADSANSNQFNPNSDTTDTKPKKLANVLQEKAPLKINANSENVQIKNMGKIQAIKVMNGKAQLTQLSAQERSKAKKALTATLVEKRSLVKTDFQALRGMTSEEDFTAEYQEKALQVTNQLLDTIEQMLIRLGELKDKFNGASDEVKAQYPNAIERIETAEEKWSEIYAETSGYVEDRITYEEWVKIKFIIKNFKNNKENYYNALDDVKNTYRIDHAKNLATKLNRALERIRAYITKNHPSDADERINALTTQIEALEDTDTSNDQEAIKTIQTSLT